MANDPRLNFKMTFEPGDIQLVHNHTMLHDRTDYIDWEDEAKKDIYLGCGLRFPMHVRFLRCLRKDMGR